MEEGTVIYDDPSIVRRKINNYIKKTGITQTELSARIGVSTAAFFKFMKQKGRYGGNQSLVYPKAYRFLEEVNSTKKLTKTQAEKRKAIDDAIEEERLKRQKRQEMLDVYKPFLNLLQSEYNLHMSLECVYVPGMFANCTEENYAPLKALGLTPLEMLLANIRPESLPLHVLNQTHKLPAFKQGVFQLSLKSMAARSDTERTRRKSEDERRNMKRLLQDMELVKKKIANRKQGILDDTKIPSTPKPTVLDWDEWTGEEYEAPRPAGFDDPIS